MHYPPSCQTYYIVTSKSPRCLKDIQCTYRTISMRVYAGEYQSIMLILMVPYLIWPAQRSLNPKYYLYHSACILILYLLKIAVLLLLRFPSKPFTDRHMHAVVGWIFVRFLFYIRMPIVTHLDEEEIHLLDLV